jgi:hypothetical protein
MAGELRAQKTHFALDWPAARLDTRGSGVVMRQLAGMAVVVLTLACVPLNARADFVTQIGGVDIGDGIGVIVGNVLSFSLSDSGAFTINGSNSSEEVATPAFGIGNSSSTSFSITGVSQDATGTTYSLAPPSQITAINFVDSLFHSLGVVDLQHTSVTGFVSADDPTTLVMSGQVTLIGSGIAQQYDLSPFAAGGTYRETIVADVVTDWNAVLSGASPRFTFWDGSWTFNAVPEPSTLTLLAVGALCLAAYGWRRGRAACGRTTTFN